MSLTFMLLIWCWPLTSRSVLFFYDFWHVFHVQPLTLVCFYICILYMTHGTITVRRYVMWSQLTFDLKVKFTWFSTWLGIGATAFLSFDKVIPDLAHHHGMMTHIHSWALYDPDLWPQYMYKNYICTINLCLGKIVFALWHTHTKCITMR